MKFSPRLRIKCLVRRNSCTWVNRGNKPTKSRIVQNILGMSGSAYKQRSASSAFRCVDRAEASVTGYVCALKRLFFPRFSTIG